MITALVTLWTGLSPLRRALGSPLGEADNHLWMLWRAARSLAGDPGPWSNLPLGSSVSLMDPANLPPYLVAGWLDPVLGWNFLALWSVGLALFGGWWLGFELAGGGAEGRRAALVSMVAVAASPFLVGVIDFGITESWGIGWLALHAALLLRYGRLGRSSDAVLSGLTLAVAALCGWYQAFFALTIEPFLLVLAWTQGPPLGRRRFALGALGQGFLALVLTLPGALSLGARLGGQATALTVRWHAPPPRAPPPQLDWHSLPINGTDLLNLVLPGVDTVHPSKAVYLGIVVLVLAGLGLWRRPRQAGPLALAAGLLLLLAAGSWPSMAGRALGVRGPAYALVVGLPILQGISHWYRAVGAAVPLVAAIAGLGAASLRHRRALPAICGLVLLDGLLFSQTPWPRPSHPVDAPASLLTLSDELAALPVDAARPRGVIQLPFDNGREMFSTEPARLYDRWQVRHGLPRAESYEAVDSVLARSALVAGWQSATGLVSRLPPEQQPPRSLRHIAPLRDPRAVAADVDRLRHWGLGYVVLHSARAPEPEAARLAVEAALGPGRAVGPDWLWTLPVSQADPGSRQERRSQ